MRRAVGRQDLSRQDADRIAAVLAERGLDRIDAFGKRNVPVRKQAIDVVAADEPGQALSLAVRRQSRRVSNLSSEASILGSAR